jgi:5-methylthioadenosine/S-adenosylhomocysteine deaminase
MSILFDDVLVYDRDAPSLAIGPTDVFVDGDRIAAIGLTASARADRQTRIVHGGGEHLLVPGAINAHFHSPANHLKGSLPSLPLELFMLYESSADPQLRPSPREAYLRTSLAAMEMLRLGTTSVQDDAFLMPYPEPDVIDAVMSAYADVGIRAAVALDQPEIVEADKLPFLDEFASPELSAVLHQSAPMARNELLEMYDYLISSWHGAADGRLTAAVSISAPQRVSEEYFAELDALSAQHRIPLFAHILETKSQRVLAVAQPRFRGRSLVQYTSDLGLLSERMNVIHAVWVDDPDLDLIAASGAVVAHNPISNLRLGSGVMPFRRMRDRGIPIALGVDEAICGDEVNMWGVARMAGLIHNIEGFDSASWPRAAEVLDCLWRGGAHAMLRADELGQITVGCLADLALIDLRTAAFSPLNDIAGQLVYCESGSSVVMTVVNGAVVFDDGRITTVNEAALLREVREVFAEKREVIDQSRLRAGRWHEEYREMVRRTAQVEVGMTRWIGEQ